MRYATSRGVAHPVAHLVRRGVHPELADSVASYADAGPAAIERRLKELDTEWFAENLLLLAGGGLACAGIGLAFRGNKGGLVLPALVGGFILQHVLYGSCLPVELAERVGMRSRADIQRERHALQNLLHVAAEREALSRLEGEGGPALDLEIVEHTMAAG